MNKSLEHASLSGMAGGSVMFVQVLLLMPIDTITQHQYRFGLAARDVVSQLRQTGLHRLYSGLLPALVQGPLSRFGDTAANAGLVHYLDTHAPETPLVAKTLLGSVVAASWRVVLMPIDMTKVIMQLRGRAEGLAELHSRVRVGGASVLWTGSVAAFTTSVIGHLPWYLTFNYLNRHLPTPDNDVDWKVRAARHGVIGFSASVVSDACTNWLRCVKAIRQAEGISYTRALALVRRTDGLVGMFVRGLRTRIFGNGIQGLVFTALWKSTEERLTMMRQSTAKRQW